MINPKDAAARSIRHGGQVRVFNDHGAFLGVANVTDDVKPGIVVGTLGYWRTLNPVGTFSDNLVEVTSAG